MPTVNSKIAHLRGVGKLGGRPKKRRHESQDEGIEEENLLKYKRFDEISDSMKYKRIRNYVLQNSKLNATLEGIAHHILSRPVGRKYSETCKLDVISSVMSFDMISMITLKEKAGLSQKQYDSVRECFNILHTIPCGSLVDKKTSELNQEIGKRYGISYLKNAEAVFIQNMDALFLDWIEKERRNGNKSNNFKYKMSGDGALVTTEGKNEYYLTLLNGVPGTQEDDNVIPFLVFDSKDSKEGLHEFCPELIHYFKEWEKGVKIIGGVEIGIEYLGDLCNVWHTCKRISKKSVENNVDENAVSLSGKSLCGQRSYTQRMQEELLGMNNKLTMKEKKQKVFISVALYVDYIIKRSKKENNPKNSSTYSMSLVSLSERLSAAFTVSVELLKHFLRHHAKTIHQQ